MKLIILLLLVLPAAARAFQLPANPAAAFGAALSAASLPESSHWKTTTPDTLFVSDTETTYLLFPEEVLLVDIGRAGDYFAKIEGRSVFLKARHPASGPTNILVRFGPTYYTARILFAARPPRSLYDLRHSAQGVAVPTGAADGLPTIVATLGRLQLRAAAQEAQLPTLRRRNRHGLSLRLRELQNDRQALYLGLTLSNSSSIDYQLDFVGFRFQERGRRLFSRNNRYHREVRPYAEAAPALIPARSSETLWYALPLFAMTSRGRLQLLFREKEGARILSLSVPARMINRAPLLEDSHEP